MSRLVRAQRATHSDLPYRRCPVQPARTLASPLRLGRGPRPHHLFPCLQFAWASPQATISWRDSQWQSWTILTVQASHAGERGWPIYHSPVTNREMVKPSSPSSIRSTELIATASELSPALQPSAGAASGRPYSRRAQPGVSAARNEGRLSAAGGGRTMVTEPRP